MFICIIKGFLNKGIQNYLSYVKLLYIGFIGYSLIDICVFTIYFIIFNTFWLPLITSYMYNFQ